MPFLCHPNKILCVILSEQIPDLSTDTNAGGEHGIPNASMYSIPFESPKDKSSPVYQYASQRPSYRRRSIHPDRPGLDSPYADFPLPDAHSRKSPGTFFKRAKPARVLGMGSESSASGCKLQDWLCMPVHFAISFVGALWFFVIRLIHHLRSKFFNTVFSPGNFNISHISVFYAVEYQHPEQGYLFVQFYYMHFSIACSKPFRIFSSGKLNQQH